MWLSINVYTFCGSFMASMPIKAIEWNWWCAIFDGFSPNRNITIFSNCWGLLGKWQYASSLNSCRNAWSSREQGFSQEKAMRYCMSIIICCIMLMFRNIYFKIFQFFPTSGTSSNFLIIVHIFQRINYHLLFDPTFCDEINIEECLKLL